MVKVFTDIQELSGKKIFRDPRLEKLRLRFDSAKISFFSVEFTDKNRDSSHCIVAERKKLLDFIVEDIEKGESLLGKAEGKEAVAGALKVLNNEKLLSEELKEEELGLLKDYSFVTAKPIVVWQGQEVNKILEEIFKKTASIFFFTVNKKEARAWRICDNTAIVAAAAKIHTDLARGFIRGEVYNFADLENFKNLEEAKQRGILKTVGRDYIVKDGDVLNIKFKI